MGGVRVFVMILGEMAVDEKVYVYHRVQSGVNGNHWGKYLFHQVEIFLAIAFLYLLTARIQEASADPVSEHLEDENWVPDTREIGANINPGDEFVPLTPVIIFHLDAVG